MKAAVLRKFGAPLSVGQVADPVAGRSEVLVDVAAPRRAVLHGRAAAWRGSTTRRCSTVRWEPVLSLRPVSYPALGQGRS